MIVIFSLKAAKFLLTNITNKNTWENLMLSVKGLHNKVTNFLMRADNSFFLFLSSAYFVSHTTLTSSDTNATDLNAGIIKKPAKYQTMLNRYI